ncbi:hypothetical protein [Oceanobacter mangrovi]|uniref:hypothetical protein n=1 Tax=Oceanobacter mangrovi TaxID=2862510 RepID=UPI001C8EE688|nr:hypothetical protein [Oceanobacter mangrovi]
MDNAKDPIVPDITPSIDDIEIRQRQMKNRRPTSAPVSNNSAGGSSALAIVALLVGLLAAGAAGFLFWQTQQLQQQLVSANDIVDKQGASLKALNDRLSATGENASLSLDALKVLLKEHDSEIRKLWDVANKRNKQGIADNAKGIAANDRELKGLNKTAEQLGGSLGEQKLVLDQQQLDLSALSDRVVSTEAAVLSLPESELRIAQNSESTQFNQRAVKSLQTALAAREKEIETLTTRLKMLEQRVTTLHTPAATQ